MGVLKKLAGQTAIYGISSVLGRVLNFLLTPLHTAVFAKGALGIVATFYASVTFVNVILTFGMETTFFRFIQDSKDPKKVYNQAFFWVMLMASLFLSWVLVFRNGIAQALGYPGEGLMVALTAGFVFLDMVAALPMARLRHLEKAKRFALINLTNIGIIVAANFLFLAVLGNTEIVYVFIANLIGSAVRTSLALVGNLPSKLLPDTRLLRNMLEYGFYIMIAGLAGTVNETFDRLVIPRWWEDGSLLNGIPQTGEELNGVYYANYKVAMLIALFSQAFRYAAEPFFFKSAGEKDSPETFARVFHYFTLATLTGFLILASFTKEIISFDLTLGLAAEPKTFIAEAYWEGLVVVPILLLAYVFSAAYINISIWFKITKQTRFALLFTGVGAFITILINYFGIPAYGYIASAWATLVCYVVMSVMVYMVGQKYYPIPYRAGRIGLYALAILVAYGINQRVGPTDGYWLAFVFKAGVCLAALGIIIGLERLIPPFVTSSQINDR